MLERAWWSWKASPARARVDWPRGALGLLRATSVVLLLLGLVSFPGRAHAEDGARTSKILLTVAAPVTDAEALAAVARELLERLDMEIELRPVERIDMHELRRAPAGGAPYFARVWVAFEKTGKARLYLEHAARDRVLLRDVLDEAHNPELVREELGHILQTAVEGLRAGEEIGAPRDEALKQVDDEAANGSRAEHPVGKAVAGPAEPAAPPRARRFRFGPRYELVWLGDGRFEDGPGAVLGALLPGSRRLGLELGGFFHRPLKVDASPVGARLQSLALAGLASFEIPQGTSSRWRLAAGVEANLVRMSPFAESARDVQLAKSRWLKLALGRLALTYAQGVGKFVDVEVTLGAEIDPGRTRFVFRGSSASARVFSPWPVRPLVSLGATVP